MRGRCRRTFLRSATRGLAVATAAGLVGSTRASTTVWVSGRVVCADGEPAGDVTMEANTNSYPEATTDGDGYFSLDVPANTGFYLRIYEYKTDGSPPKRDGVPFMYDFGERSVENGDANLATLKLPETHRVTLRVLRPSANRYRARNPTSRRRAAATGSARPRRKSARPATTKEPATTVSAETPTTSRGTTGGTAATTVRKSSTTATAPNSTRNRRRGFFSNGSDDASAGGLEDPYFLTVGGFALSVGGVLHQLVRGR